MHLVYSLDVGGLENGVVNLCNRLDPQRFAVTLCSFRGGGGLEVRLNRDRVELVTARKLGRNDPSLPFRLAWQLRRRRIDILHTHAWGTLVEGIAAAKVARTPVVIHGEHGTLETRFHNLRIQRFLWSYADQVTAVAIPLADRMAETIGFAGNRIRVIPNGVDTVRFHPDPAQAEQRRKKFGLPTRELLVGMVARLNPVKNHAGVLHALARLRDSDVKLNLALAGDGPLLEELQSLTEELALREQVFFLGDVIHVEEFLNVLDIFVLNSHSEGMSNTVLEAMACGLPVVATTVGANSDLIENDRTGLLIPPNDSEALARALKTLADAHGTRAGMGRAARERIEQSFSMETMVEEYSNMYESMPVRSRCSSGRPIKAAVCGPR